MFFLPDIESNKSFKPPEVAVFLFVVSCTVAINFCLIFLRSRSLFRFLYSYNVYIGFVRKNNYTTSFLHFNRKVLYIQPVASTGRHSLHDHE